MLTRMVSASTLRGNQPGPSVVTTPTITGHGCSTPGVALAEQYSVGGLTLGAQGYVHPAVFPVLIGSLGWRWWQEV